MGIRSIKLVLQDGAMLVGTGPESQSFATPAALWQALASSTDALHLCAADQTPQGAALHRVADQLADSGAIAALGALRDAEGRLIAPLPPSAAAYAPVAPGTLVLSPRALRHLPSPPGPWDAFWPADLLRALHRAGPVLTVTEVLACGGAASPGGLLPLSRAAAGFDPDLPTLVILSPPDASCALYFDRFRTAPDLNLRILPPVAAGGALVWLAQASAVIIPRDIAALVEDGTTALLQRLGIPVFWFLDDDLFALAAEYPVFAPYLSPDVRPLAAGVTGLIAATPALAAALQHRLALPAAPPVLPPGPAPDWPAAVAPPAAIAAVIGGAFRGPGLRDVVLPALRRATPHLAIAAQDNLRPFLTGNPAQFLPFEGDFLSFLHAWQALRPALLIHPPGQSSNMANKSDATILLAHALGAVPIVAAEPAFHGWDEATGVLVVTPEGWEAALRRASDPAQAALLRARLSQAVAARGHTAPDLLALLGRPAPVGAATRDLRLQRLLDAPDLRPTPRARRTVWARLRRSLWKRGLWPGDHAPRIAPR